MGHDIEKKLHELSDATIWGLLCIAGNQRRELEAEVARHKAALEAEQKTALEYAMAVSDAVCGHAVSAAGLESSVVREIVAMNRRLVEYERTAGATYGLVAEISAVRRLANRLTEELALEQQVTHQANRTIVEALAELGLDIAALAAAPYDAEAINDLRNSLPTKIRALVKQRDEAVAERDGLRDSRARWQQHCADSANKYADQRDEAMRQVEQLRREQRPMPIPVREIRRLADLAAQRDEFRAADETELAAVETWLAGFPQETP